MDKGTHVSAVHIPGKQNILSETASRKFHDASEWMLSKNMFNHLIACFGMPEIDIFAYRLNKQLHRYASWMPDIYVLSIDIMPISWENQFVCLFPMDMACCEQDIIGIDKNSCNSSNVANTVIVQKIVRSSSGAANDFQKQISENPRYISKHLLYPEREIQKKTINVLNAAWRDGTKNKYKYIFRRWEKFCSERNYNTM